MTDTADEYYYEKGFLVILRSEMPLLRASSVTVLTPTNQQLYKYVGDFYGLLDELGVPKCYHFATLLLNNLENTSDFKDSMVNILIPDYQKIDQLHTTYTTLFET